jgi:hypothetical protein
MIFTNRNFDILQSYCKADIYCNIFNKISEFHFKIKYLYNYKNNYFDFIKLFYLILVYHCKLEKISLFCYHRHISDLVTKGLPTRHTRLCGK